MATQESASSKNGSPDNSNFNPDTIFSESFKDKYEVNIVDSKKDENGVLLYKVVYSVHVWSKEDELVDHPNMISDFWAKNEDDKTDVAPRKHRARKRKASNPKKIADETDIVLLENDDDDDYDELTDSELAFLDDTDIENNSRDGKDNELDDDEDYIPSKCSRYNRRSSKENSGQFDQYEKTISDSAMGDEELPHLMKCSYCDNTFLNNADFRKHFTAEHKNKKYFFKCSVCGRAFNRMAKFWHHTNTHNDPKTYTCNICKKAYKYHHSLQEHIDKVHGVKEPFCNICLQTFDSVDQLELHCTDSHDGAKFLCMICSEVFKEEDGYDKHTKTCKQRFHCSQCTKSFVSRSDCRMHEKTHDGSNPHYCEICDKYFLKKSKLTVHLERHERRNKRDIVKGESGSRIQFLCPHCEKKFIDKRCFTMHIKIHEGTCPYYCESCDHYFTTKTKLSMHMIAMHTKDLPFACENCDKKFKFKHYLQDHMKTHSKNTEGKNLDPTKKFRCKTCNEGFERTSELKKHLEYSSACLSIECHICGQKFQDKKRLNVHIKVHSIDQSHDCPTCSKKFRHKTDLKKHVRIHSVETQFACSKCDKTFIENWQLKAHMEWHETGKHPFQCPICEKIMGKHSKLQSHIRQVHNKERDHVCDTCGKEYSTKADLKKHERTHDSEYEHGEFMCMVCHADGFTREGLEEHQLIHLRVETSKSTVLDFSQLYQMNQNHFEVNSDDYNETVDDAHMNSDSENDDHQNDVESSAGIDFRQIDATEISAVMGSSQLTSLSNSEVASEPTSQPVLQDETNINNSVVLDKQEPAVLEVLNTGCSLNSINTGNSEGISTASVNTAEENVNSFSTDVVDGADDDSVYPRNFSSASPEENAVTVTYSTLQQVMSAASNQASLFHSVQQLLIAAQESGRDTEAESDTNEPDM